MKCIPLPQADEARRKKRAQLHRTGVFFNICIVAFAILAILLLLGMLIVVMVFEFGKGIENRLFYILIGTFAGGAVVFALSAFCLNLLARRHRDAELDFRERLHGDESFFVGDGTLVTFEGEGIRIHGEDGGGKEVLVPYSEMRFFSVCTRRRPREKGEWSVVLEIPARYLPRRDGDGSPALIQTDAKDRLDAALSRHGLTLLGEKRNRAHRANAEKFTLNTKFILPHREKRRNALLFGGLGAVLAVAGIFIAIFWQLTIGVLLIVFGPMIAARAALSFVRAKGVLGVYDEGIFWRDIGRVDSVFLKWDEIVKIERTVSGNELLRVTCAYGAYHFPAIRGAFEVLAEQHPEKVQRV